MCFFLSFLRIRKFFLHLRKLFPLLQKYEAGLHYRTIFLYWGESDA